jgi:TolB-like protein/lipoprotein NlpI
LSASYSNDKLKHIDTTPMKRCPQCNRVEADDNLAFCRADGVALINVSGSVSGDVATTKFGSGSESSEIQTSLLPHTSTTPEINRNTGPTTVLTPGQTQATTRDLAKPKRRVFASAALGLLLVVVLGLGYLYWFYWARAKNSDAPIESIAVLPFQNKNSDTDSEYLSDGLAESLIFRLSQLPGLKVSPTSSVMRYKGKEPEVERIAKELGVEAVMTGRFVKRGNNLNITVELVDVKNNKSLWGEHYERKVSDLLTTQREMATVIAQKLQLKLAGNESRGITKRYTDNNEAYQLYLKGRFHFYKRSKDDLERSIDLFKQAIRLDPDFALAHVGLAESYGVIPSFPFASANEMMPQAKAAAARALELDPDLPEAHAVAGMIAATYDWDWTRAEREFKKSLELDPNIANTHYRYAWVYLSPVGRHEDAISEMKRAMELEPLSLQQGANFAAVYMYARQFDLAVEQAKKTYELDPGQIGAQSWLQYTYNAKGMYAESLSMSEKISRSDYVFFGQRGIALAKAGRRQEAEEVLKSWRELAKTRYVMAYWMAAVYAALGNKDAAFAELEKSYQQREWFFPRLKTDPFMDPLRTDPRFADLEKRIGLPQ